MVLSEVCLTSVCQCCGLRPWSYDKTGLRPVPVLVLVLQFRSWSCTSGLGLGLGLKILVLFPTLLSVAYIGPKSRTERPRKTKIGTEVAHVTRDSDTTFKVKRSKVNLRRGRGILWRPPAQLV